MPVRTARARRLRRLAGRAAALSVSVVASTWLVAVPAAAAVLGTVVVTPASGTDSTLFAGTVQAACPAGTVDSFFEIKGDDVGMRSGTTTSGSGDLGFLGPGNSSGRGPQSFTGASIANLASTNSGSFRGNGDYRIRFVCIDGAGLVSNAYETPFAYRDTSAGTWTAKNAPAPTASSSAGSPTSPVPSDTSSPTASGEGALAFTPTPAATVSSSADGSSPGDGSDGSGGSGLAGIADALPESAAGRGALGVGLAVTVLAGVALLARRRQRPAFLQRGSA